MQKASRLGNILLEKRYSSDPMFVDSRFEQRKLRRGDMLYSPVDSGKTLFLVESGLIKLEYFLANGSGRIVRLVEAGQFAGLEVLVEPRYLHYAQALCHSRVLRIPTSLFKRLFNQSEPVRHEIYQLYQGALEETDAWIRLFNAGSARQRLAQLLLRTHPSSDKPGFLLHYDDIGSIIGVRPETVCRVVQNLKQLNAVRFTGPGQIVVDREQLQRIALIPGSAPLQPSDIAEQKAG